MRLEAATEEVPKARPARQSAGDEGTSARSKPRRAKSRARSNVLGDAGDPSLVWRRVVWVVAAALWLIVLCSLLSFHLGDAPSSIVAPHNVTPLNWCGAFGAVVAFYSFQMFGLGAWVVLALWGLALGVTMSGRAITQAPLRVIGTLLLAAGVAGLQALLLPRSGPIPGLPGGLVGTLVAIPDLNGSGGGLLTHRFGALGAGLWLLLVLAIGAVVTLDVWAVIVAMWTGRALWTGTRTSAAWSAQLAGAAAQAARDMRHRREQRRKERAKSERAAIAAARAGAKGDVRVDDISDDDTIPEVEDMPGSAKKKGAAAVAVEEDAYDDAEESGDDDEGDANADEGDESDTDIIDEADEADDERDDDAEPVKKTFTAEELREKMSKLPLRFASATKQAATDDDLRDLQGGGAEIEGYRFPGLDLLEDPEQNYNEKLEAAVREQAGALEKALKEYRIDGSVVGIDSGPVITNFEVRLAPGTKVAVLTAISSDLARALKAVNIRIVPNTAGRDTVGIEVPNSIKEKVRLKELMSKSAAEGGSDGTLFAGSATAKMALPMFLGKDASGAPLIADLATMPHALIAGTTGSGKSVCMNTIIMSFLYTKKPSELKMVLVDPKMVEMSQFKDIPHLMCPVVTEMSKAAAILEWAVNKMEERYELLAEAGCRDIAGYNALTWEELKDSFQPSTPEEEARIPRKLPYMVFIIDELADLMMTNKEVEHSIVRIAQKARAVGMHLILATQRPQANVVTGLIKSNMPARIAFKVASGMDSRIVLDQKGGELLLGQGDMLYLSPRSSKLSRAQGTLVDDKEIRRVVRFMRDVAAPTFERQLMQIRSGGGSTSEEDLRDGLANAQEDPLFDQAVEIVLETKRGSVSMLQRRLAIGYTRAARLIELMGEAGILGQHKGTVAREVAMSLEEWQAIKEQAARDAAQAEAAAEGESATEPEDVSSAQPGNTVRKPIVEPKLDAARDLGLPANSRKKPAAVDEDEFPDAFVERDDDDAPFEPRRGR